MIKNKAAFTISKKILRLYKENYKKTSADLLLFGRLCEESLQRAFKTQERTELYTIQYNSLNMQSTSKSDLQKDKINTIKLIHFKLYLTFSSRDSA